MRIASATAAAWLAGVFWVGMAAANEWVNFSTTPFEGVTGSTAGVIPLSLNSGSQMFNWQAKIQVEQVQLINMVSGQPSILAQGSTSIVTTSTSLSVSSSATPTTTPAGIDGILNSMSKSFALEGRATSSTTATMQFNASPTDGSVTIELPEFVDKGELFFVALFNNSNGRSYSRNFTITNKTPQNPDFDSLEQQYSNTDPVLSETVYGSGSTATASSTTSATASSSTAADGVGLQTTSPTTSTNANSDSGSGGLSTGAIVGIAVAAALVFLAFLCFLAWCLLFRRKSNRNSMAGLGYKHDRNRTQELMVEKEASAGINTSTHLPYSDENLTTQDSAETTAEDTGPVVLTARTSSLPPARPQQQQAHQQQDQQQGDHSLTPYSDRPISTSAIGVAVSTGSPTMSSAPLADNAAPLARAGVNSPVPGRDTPGRATPQGAYPHLVEEGMTEADILRLEEEERELDAAIEHARARH